MSASERGWVWSAKHRRWSSSAAWIGPIILLTACSSKTDANEENFRAVIAQQIRDSRCETLPLSNVPLTKESSGSNTLPILRVAKYEAGYGALDDAPLKELVAVGLFTRDLKTMPAFSGFSGIHGKPEPVDVAVYAPTNKARPVMRMVQRKTSAGKPHDYQALCRADSEVESIDNFTKPSEAFGATVSIVSYTSRPKQSGKQKALFPLSGAAAAPRQEKMTLFLTDKGWVAREEAGF